LAALEKAAVKVAKEATLAAVRAFPSWRLVEAMPCTCRKSVKEETGRAY